MQVSLITCTNNSEKTIKDCCLSIFSQSYGNITIFQANMPCVACGNAGCDNRHGKSECLDHISPKVVFDEVKNWHQNFRF